MKGIITGLQNLWSGFLTIINALKMFLTFMINLVKSIIDLLGILINIVGQVMNFTVTLPSWLIAFITASLSVAILYQIIGRESGK